MAAVLFAGAGAKFGTRRDQKNRRRFAAWRCLGLGVTFGQYI
jgi:hypothetical protein